MAINTTPVSTTGKPQGKGSKKSVGSSRAGGKQQTLVRPTSIPREGKQSEALTNMFQLLRGGPMQVSKQGVPHRVIVGDPTKDSGYLRPPTQQDIEYGERLQRAQQLKESGRLPGGRDPVAVEQRITAAERQTPTWRDEGDSLRESIYGKGPIKGTLSNVGDMLTGAYSATLGQAVPFAYLPGGAIHNAGWSAQPNLAEGWPEHRILQGEGTPFDQSRSWQRRLDSYKHKYYGQPNPGPRPRNVYDNLGMPQPKPRTPMIDYGQDDIPLYLRSAGEAIDRDFGPAKVPPPGSDKGPPGSMALQGIFPNHYFGSMPGKQPPSSIDFGGDRGGPGEEEEEGKKKETFNILKFLMGLLGLPFKLLGLTLPGEEEEKKKKTGGLRQPQRQRIPWQAENRMNRQRYQPPRATGK